MIQFSLRPVAARLEELLKTTVLFAEDAMAADTSVSSLKAGQVLLLENVRFYKNESSKKEDERLVMARKLASYGDLFVSDAFGTAHRNAASSKSTSFYCRHVALCGEFAFAGVDLTSKYGVFSTYFHCNIV